MNSCILLMIFVLQIQWVTCNNTSKLGISPCMYSGDFDKYGYFCPPTPMKIDLLPPECTSFVYEGIQFDDQFGNITITDKDKTNIINLAHSGKPLYLYIGYKNPKCWIKAVNDINNTATKLLNLKTHLEGITVTGIILKNLTCDPDSNYVFKGDFFKNLKQYVTTIKSGSTFAEIGLYVPATKMIFYNSYSDVSSWFVFNDWMNDLMDYYIIGFDKFNPCNNHFKDGIVPLYNVYNSNNSLTTFSTVFYNSTIAKNKIYLEFSACPTQNDTTNEHLPTCCVTYKKYCEKDNYNTFWCADNAHSYFQKGRFARDLKAKGIVIKYIDTIDPTAKCDCDNKNMFITFTMMLNSFLSKDPIRDCAKLNGINPT